MTSQSCHKSLQALAKIVAAYFFAEEQWYDQPANRD
jgi:hypothetical protein